MVDAPGKQVSMEELEQPKIADRKGKRAALYFHDELGTVIAGAELTARYFGVTPQTLSNWVKNGCPRHEYGYYDIKAVGEYRLRVTGAAPAPGDPKELGDMSVLQQKAYFEQKLKAAQAEAAELRNAVMRGDYLERQKVILELKDFAVILKRSLQGLGKKIAREVSGQIGPSEARRFDRLMADTIDDALEQLSVEGVYRYDGK